MAKKKGTRFFEISFFTSDWILSNLTFFIFLGFLAVIYIANAHYAERNVRRIQVLQKELKELRWHYMSLQSENMYNSKQSEISVRVRREGLRPMQDRPKKIVVDRENE